MAETANQTTIIGQDTQIKGEMSFEGSAKILGKFDGKINSKGEVQVGEGAVCKATIDSATLIVDGEIFGNVTVRERLKLNSTAKVNGDIIAKTLIVAEGATFLGQCQVGAEAVEKALAAAGSTDSASVAVETRVSRPSVTNGLNTGGRSSGWNGSNGKNHDTTTATI